jgi:tetratricopeptide (TPR) repeat protein
MKKLVISRLILTCKKEYSAAFCMLLCGLMFSGCAQTSKTFAWLKKAPQNVAQNLPRPSPKIKNPANLHVHYARWQEQLGKMSEAQSSYEQALSDNPKSVDAILGLARLDHLAGREMAAEHGFKKALRLKPNDPHTLDTIGQFYVSQKQWPQAIEMLTAAMDANPKETAYQYHLGVALARSGDINGAFPHLENTVGKSAAHYNIGYVLMEENQYPLAHDHLKQAIALNPELVAAQTMIEVINKKMNYPQQGINPQSPVLASKQSPTPSVQPVSGNQDSTQWNTVTLQEQEEKIIPQSYQKIQNKTETKWAPAVYTPEYPRGTGPQGNGYQGNGYQGNGTTQTSPQPPTRTVQGNKSVSISPGTPSESQFKLPVNKVIPEQYQQ